MSETWTKRELFKEWVHEAQNKLGSTNIDPVAELMELSPNTLYRYLSSKKNKCPSRKRLQLLGDFLDRDYRALLNDPEAVPPGMDEAAWAELTDRRRLVARIMMENLQSIPPDQEELYCQLFTRAMREAIETGRMTEMLNLSKK